MGLLDNALKAAERGLTKTFVEPGMIANRSIESRLTDRIAGKTDNRVKRLLTPNSKTAGPVPLQEGMQDTSLGDYVFGTGGAIKDAAKEYFWKGTDGRGLTGTQRAARIGAGWMVGSNVARLASGGTPFTNSNGESDIAGLPF